MVEQLLPCGGCLGCLFRWSARLSYLLLPSITRSIFKLLANLIIKPVIIVVAIILLLLLLAFLPDKYCCVVTNPWTERCESSKHHANSFGPPSSADYRMYGGIMLAHINAKMNHDVVYKYKLYFVLFLTLQSLLSHTLQCLFNSS